MDFTSKVGLNGLCDAKQPNYFLRDHQRHNAD